MFNFEVIQSLIQTAAGRDQIRRNSDLISLSGWTELCTSSFFIDLIEENKDSLDSWCWLMLSSNESALPIIEANPQYLDNECWGAICANKAMVPLIERMNLQEIDEYMFYGICTNENAIHLIEPIIEQIEQYCPTAWTALSMNKAAIPLIEKYGFDKMTEHCIYLLSGYPSALHIVKRHEDLIDFNAMNILIRNPEADSLTKAHMSKLRPTDWEGVLYQRPEFASVMITNRDRLAKDLDLHIHFNLTLVSAQPVECRKELFAQLRFLPRFVEKWISEGGQPEDMV